MVETEDDVLELGGSIQLSGFSSVDKASMIILKKIVGNYAKKFSERSENFESLGLTAKPIHQNQDSAPNKYELHAKLVDNGKVYASEVTDNNVFVAVDSALKKVEAESTR